MNEIGIYVHIPFCKRKCFYCDFNSYENKSNLLKEYVNWLVYDIEQVGKGNFQNYQYNKNSIVKTIYIGGGTPSILDSKEIEKIVQTIKNNFIVFQDAEITIEINPGTVDVQKLQDYYNCGINRLSIGLQETDDELLKLIGRIHTYEQFLKIYKNARKVGFNNINIDLMIGLPKQSLENVQQSIKKIINLDPEHISVYSLIVEEGTRISELIENGEVLLIEDDKEREMYWLVKSELEKNGYYQYEISNFSKKYCESKHNIDCWNQKDYLGFGVGAHSYMNSVRFSVIESIEQYIENLKSGKNVENLIIHEVQTMDTSMKEFMILGLRKIEGVSISEFKNKFVQNPLYIFRRELKKLVEEDLIEINDNYIRLNKKGMDFANIVWEEFV